MVGSAQCSPNRPLLCVDPVTAQQGRYLTPILQMNIKFRDVRQLAQGHTAISRRIWIDFTTLGLYCPSPSSEEVQFGQSQDALGFPTASACPE